MNEETVDHIQAEKIGDAFTMAQIMTRAAGDADPSHEYEVAGIVAEGTSGAPQASIGWLTSEEWNAEHEAKKAKAAWPG